jgi:hypothetical protein
VGCRGWEPRWGIDNGGAAMNRKTVALEGVPDVGDASPVSAGETGWRALLGSRKWAAILVVGCVVGLIAALSGPK